MVKQFLLLGALMFAVRARFFGGASDFGTTGLIKMPDARMEEDGVLRATIALDEAATSTTSLFKLFPKVQATFRYSIFNPTDLQGSRDDFVIEATRVKSQFFKRSAIGARDSSWG